MRDELARITAADMSSRVPQPRTGDEIARLAVTMNETLDRLADAVERQRRSVADAAHELRSPLAGLRNTAEVAATHGGAVDPEVLRTGTERLQRLTDDLLLLARLERTAPAAGEAGRRRRDRGGTGRRAALPGAARRAVRRGSRRARTGDRA